MMGQTATRVMATILPPRPPPLRREVSAPHETQRRKRGSISAAAAACAWRRNSVSEADLLHSGRDHTTIARSLEANKDTPPTSPNGEDSFCIYEGDHRGDGSPTTDSPRARVRSFEEQPAAIAQHFARRRRHVAARARRRTAALKAGAITPSADVETPRHRALRQSQDRQTRPVSWELGDDGTTTTTATAAAAPTPIQPRALLAALPIAEPTRFDLMQRETPYFRGTPVRRAMDFAEREAARIEWEVNHVAPLQPSLGAEQAGAVAYEYARTRDHGLPTQATARRFGEPYLGLVFDAVFAEESEEGGGGGSGPDQIPRGVDRGLVFAAVVAQLRYLAQRRAWQTMISKATSSIMLPRFAGTIATKDVLKQRLRSKTLTQRSCRRRRNTAGFDFQVFYANMQHLVEHGVAETGRTLFDERDDRDREGGGDGGGECTIS